MPSIKIHGPPPSEPPPKPPSAVTSKTAPTPSFKNTSKKPSNDKPLTDADILTLLEDTFSVKVSSKTGKKVQKSNKKAKKTTALLDQVSIPSIHKKQTSKSHQVSKEMPLTVKKVAVMVGTIAIAAILGLFAYTAGGITKSVLSLKDNIMAKLDPNNLTLATKKMKKAEEFEKFTALQDVINRQDWLEGLEKSTEIDLKNNVTKKMKLERFILRSIARKGEPLNQESLDKADLCYQLKEEDFANQEVLLNTLNKLSPAHQLLSVADASLFFSELMATDPTSLDEEAKKFNQTVKDLVHLMKSSPTDMASRNKQITKKLRECLSSPVYQALKDHPHNQSVQLLHSLSSAIWNKVQALDAYRTLGEATLRRLPSHEVDDKPMHQLLQASHKKASQELFTDHGLPGKILYALSHPLQVLGSMASSGGVLKTMAETFQKGVYDSHYLLGNNPSLQGMTYVELDTEAGSKISTQINNCYGGSPTVDDTISPEFEALCQASENKRFGSDFDPSIPDIVYYTNFQAIEGQGEGSRSATIMNQNKRYPLSFRGITLAKDSEFYLMPTLKKDPESIKWEGAAVFGQEMFARMTHDSCFSTIDRIGNHEGNGFYFPGNKEEWAPIFEKCIESAQRHFKQAPAKASGKEAYLLRGAFQEYVYSMLQAHIELKLANEVSQTGSKQPVITAIRACKENIDRGGAENAKYMYTRLSPNEYNASERATLVTGVLQSRALSARDRVIIESRLPQVLAFMEHVKPEDFQNEMIDTMKALGINFADGGTPHFVPALKSPKI